jgi:hypothetical protein
VGWRFVVASNQPVLTMIKQLPYLSSICTQSNSHGYWRLTRGNWEAASDCTHWHLVKRAFVSVESGLLKNFEGLLKIQGNFFIERISSPACMSHPNQGLFSHTVAAR